MQKILITLIMIITLSGNLLSQIVVTKFTGDSYKTKQIAGKLENEIKSELKKYYFVLERDFTNLQKEHDLSKIRNYFKNSISPNFEPASYIMTGNITSSKGFSSLFDINIEVTNTESAKKLVISETYLKESYTDTIADIISKFLKNSIPSYITIQSFVSDETLSLNYGKDRGANEGDELEIISIYKLDVIGIAEIDEVFSNSSYADFDLHNEMYAFDNRTYREYYCQTKINRDKANDIIEELNDLKDQDAIEHINEIVEEEKEQKSKRLEEARRTRELKFRDNDWLILGIKSFSIYSDEMAEFFDNNIYSPSPLTFFAQANLAKTDLRGFIKGAISLEGEANSSDTFNGNEVKTNSSFFFYQLGGGIQNRFGIFDFLYPGMSIGVYFMGGSLNEEKTGLLTTSDPKHYTFRGINIECSANVMVRLFKLGIYSELSYNFFPYYQSDEIEGQSSLDFSGSGLSVSLGVTFFFKK